MRSGGAFSDEEIQLLRGLPAVSNVTRDRITYSDTFRQVCTIRYLAGESPTKIFREAGLPPELVGYKRIERSVARWKEAAIKSVNGSNTMTDGEIIAQLAARYKRALATRRSLEDIANTATEPKAAATVRGIRSQTRPLREPLPQRLRRMTFIRCLSDCSTVIRPALLSGSRLVVSTSSSAMW